VLFYDEETDQVLSMPGKVAAYRSDNKRGIEVVSPGYKFVQPPEVLDFFTDIIEGLGYQMTTCGVLFGGKRFWAQATTGDEAMIGGVDKVKDSILLATGFLGSTVAMRTMTRVVCWNTWQQAMRGGGKVKVSHSTEFNASQVKKDLGLNLSTFQESIEIMEILANIPMKEAAALDYFGRVFEMYEGDNAEASSEERIQIAASSKIVMGCYELFCGDAKGSDLKTADGTLWGAFNSVTEYADHVRKTQTNDSRIDSAWFGPYANVKNRAWDEAVLMAA
jgi:phage/plasmid-like protein (TIGR03299 family)